MSEQDIIDGLIKRVNSEAHECPGCGNTGLDSSHSWCQVCGGDSAIAMQTIRHAFIAGAESKHPQGYRVGGWVYRTPDDAAEAYFQHANVSGATRTDSVVAEGVTAGETALLACRHGVTDGDHCPDCEAMKA